MICNVLFFVRLIISPITGIIAVVAARRRCQRRGPALFPSESTADRRHDSVEHDKEREEDKEPHLP